ncbi:hypothetical protein [Luteimonas sp. R10]|uniref:hypothetical protein n=1 Tax=Luteimonas sp. R10 TaxID=3108176 RepID=UPI00308CA35E|nr:hypothetical protein U3649_03400 [Luteimonas sp. R10]
MASIDQIRSAAELLPDREMRDLCARIIESVGQRRGRSEKAYWTFQNFSSWVDRAPDDALLQRCLMFLASRDGTRLLDMHFLFFDPEHPEDLGEPIEDDEVAAAIKTGYLIAPTSGDEVTDFERSLVPYFVPSESLQAG